MDFAIDRSAVGLHPAVVDGIYSLYLNEFLVSQRSKRIAHILIVGIRCMKMGHRTLNMNGRVRRAYGLQTTFMMLQHLAKDLGESLKMI